MLQQRARQVLDLRNKGRPAITGGLSQLDGADTRYRCASLGLHGGWHRVLAGTEYWQSQCHYAVPALRDA